MLTTGNSVIETRLKKFREKMKQKGIDSAIVTKRENYLYLSGFTGSSAFLVITLEKQILLTDFRYVEQASKQAGLFEINDYKGNLNSVVNDILKKNALEKLGFEESYITFEKYDEYKNNLSISELIPLEGIIEELRIIKDNSEVDIIREAVRIADAAFKHIIGYIKPGVRELEIAAEIEYYMKKQGASGASFETIVASGERSAMPHGVASDRKLQMGDTITLDYGALYQNYCSDMTRTVFLGEPNETIKKVYNIVLEAQLKALEASKVGLSGIEIDTVARDIISGYGYGENFGHGLGHGVGLEIHEEPRLSPKGNKKMENGMVVTVEPGIYINNFAGVRIEDMIIISNDKPLVLTQSPKEIIIL